MKKIFSILFAAMCAVAVCAQVSTYRLGMIGDATAGGWSLDNATWLKPVADGEFEFVGDLGTGSMKFILMHDWNPGYGPATDGEPLASGTMAYRESDATDYKYAVVSGRYKIQVNMSTLSITVSDATGMDGVQAATAVFPQILYPIGNALPCGWTISESPKMQESAYDSGLYMGRLTLGAGELKFLCQPSWDKHYGPADAGTALDATGVIDCALIAEGDHKWNVSLVGEYDVTIDLHTNHVTIVEASASALENVSVEKAEKVMENGRVVIIREGVRYDVLGKKL